MNIYTKLALIQHELKAPKNQVNKFGGYNYRSCEDILESLKPLLIKTNTSLIITDNVELIGNRFYIKATAKLINNEALENANNEVIEVFAYAREPESVKGQSEAQITGASSSYARKYALNGLFAIDDTKDNDFTNKHEITTQKQTKALTNDQITELSELIELSNTDINAFYSFFGVSELRFVPFQKAKSMLIAKLKKS